ncbi:MAG: RSP_2648 family PIN domain-containing protein [Halocynthiibacter sp.]
MKLLLDACVLYPTVMREALLGAAKAGLYTPLWSPRILEEWARAAARLGPVDELQARGEIATLQAQFPNASIRHDPALERRLYLPDDNDLHVLAAAIVGNADAIVTMNRKDFPKGTLREEGLDRLDPDGLLMQFWIKDDAAMTSIGQGILQTASTMSDDNWTARSLFKKARLPRFAKALSAQID